MIEVSLFNGLGELFLSPLPEDGASETAYSLVSRIPKDVQGLKAQHAECYKPSAKAFRIDACLPGCGMTRINFASYIFIYVYEISP